MIAIDLYRYRFLSIDYSGLITITKRWNVCVVVIFLFQLVLSFPLFLGMVVYANEFKTKEKQKINQGIFYVTEAE